LQNLFRKVDVQEILVGHVIKRWKCGWQAYFGWRHEATFIEKILLCFVFAFFTGVSAQIVIRLPFTPVPFTGQVIVVLLSGVLLGKNWAGISQIMYLVGGMTVIPWFAGGEAGMMFLLPSFGYIVGFIPASFFIGYCFDKGYGRQSISRQIFLMLVGIAVVHCFGAVWFSFLMGTGLKTTLFMAVIPFISFDILKAYFVAYLAVIFFPQISCDGKCFKN